MNTPSRSRALLAGLLLATCLHSPAQAATGPGAHHDPYQANTKPTPRGTFTPWKSKLPAIRTHEHPMAVNAGYWAGTRMCLPAGSTATYPVLVDTDDDGFCPDSEARSIRDLEFDATGELLYAGYGNYGRNLDSNGIAPVMLLPLNVRTGQWDWSKYAPVGSESIEVIRRDKQGRLLVPTIDPSHRRAINERYPNQSGYLTNDKSGGKWRFVHSKGATMTHTYDVDIDDRGGVWLSGSIGNDATTLYASSAAALDAGDSKVVHRNAPDNGYDRFYWGRLVGAQGSSQNLLTRLTNSRNPWGEGPVQRLDNAFVVTQPGLPAGTTSQPERSTFETTSRPVVATSPQQVTSSQDGGVIYDHGIFGAAVRSAEGEWHYETNMVSWNPLEELIDVYHQHDRTIWGLTTRGIWRRDSADTSTPSSWTRMATHELGHRASSMATTGDGIVWVGTADASLVPVKTTK